MGINIQKEKIELIQWLASLEDLSVIEKIIELRINERLDWWGRLSEAEQKSIEKGIKDADEGKLKDHTKARQLYEKWLKNSMD